MKFAFITIPSQELERPPAAAAAISSCVKNVGWQCKIFDFNLYLNKSVDTLTWIKLEEYWRCKTLNLDLDVKEKLYSVIYLFLNEIKMYNPTMIGLSIFTRMSIVPAFILLTEIRKLFDSEVVIGGNGTYAWAGSIPGISSPLSGNFAEYALETKLVDYYIFGDGEECIQQLLQGNTNYPGINGKPPEQLRNLESIPLPDYQGIEPNNYFYTHEPGIYITASRGCVRKCTFCNVPTIWPKFTTRSSEHVIKEIIENKKKYNVDLFHFTDSLINGNMKLWRKINYALIEAKQQDPTLKSIKYMGQFICRTRLEQSESDWQMMANAGAELLTVGFETYSPRVRKHMGKHYSNSDIDFHLQQSAFFGIKNIALMFVAYPTETLEDHEYNIEFLHRYRKYAKSGTLAMVRWGYTGLFAGDVTKVEKSGDVKLITDPTFAQKFKTLPAGIKDIALGFGWLNELNPDLTLTERIRRRLELHEISVKLGFPQTRSREELQILYNILCNLKNNSIDATDFEKLANVLDFH